GSEWFSVELANMFDWMNRKVRANPHNQLGVQREEFKILRESDNRFYWLSTSDVSSRCLVDYAGLAKNSRVLPATLQARIANANEINLKKGGAVGGVKIWNQINLNTSGVAQVSIWLGPKMIDFAKPVILRVNSSQAGAARKVQPSIQTLLED